MKTASIPPVRVPPELRQAAEDVLQSGETLSGFVQDAVRRNIEYRRAQNEFLARGLAAREEARKSGEYYAAADVLKELDNKLARAKA